ncbi:efflux RND transporter periplasmic adaptor subunit [Streptococcus tangpeifui]|uniref:Efflux transporter, RND family, MFP subunit n=1 Tax=Streptococcus criceti HS-6 TaxID=873449 RepID=G5JN13_STRCG|nr:MULTISPECIES: efflux RND transporter periplasmic adaptor subunit [Streptococcus]EHI74189.1 efflux transporter, RND family, MFP subunit [Streptococcus criceti HS-6]SUN38881.1 ABC transporter substrate-binding protein [Streptococcus criceti]
MTRTRKKKAMSKKKKWSLIGVSILGALVIAFMIVKAFLGGGAQTTQYKTAKANKGSLASATILSGKVKSVSEQYVYYEPSKGSNPTIPVHVGDQVSAGQALVQYDATAAQADYDSAVRALNKAAADIQNFKNANAAVAGTADYNSQLQALNDAYADAQSVVTKAQLALDSTTVLSNVSGTVVEVAESINPSSQTSQTLVHVASEGQLQIQGTLTEYDLANVKVGQEVTIKSKVYPDKEWTGTISYISNYPNEKSDSSSGDSQSGSSSGSSSSSGSTYKYKVDITSDIGDLKQGFSTSIEVKSDSEAILVPVKAVTTIGDRSYVWVYDKKSGKISKTQVTLGNADAKQQQIVAGLDEGKTVIANPSKDFKDGQKLSQSDMASSNKG